MDSLSGPQMDLTKLSDAEKTDLQQFVVNESQKARIQGGMPLLYNTLPTSFPNTGTATHSIMKEAVQPETDKTA